MCKQLVMSQQGQELYTAGDGHSQLAAVLRSPMERQLAAQVKHQLIDATETGSRVPVLSSFYAGIFGRIFRQTNGTTVAQMLSVPSHR